MMAGRVKKVSPICRIRDNQVICLYMASAGQHQTFVNLIYRARMARRRELGGIASGIVGSFISRNNDVDGYWGMGKLYRYVEDSADKIIKIELINKFIHPQTSNFESLLTFYREKLFFHLARREIPATWIKSATISATFECEYIPKHHFWRSGLGKPCEVSCSIVDDKERSHFAVAYSNCWPHDPKGESCRASA